MILGALVDLGLPLDRLRNELRKLPLAGYRLEARPVDRSGIRACKVDVVVDAQVGHGHHPHRRLADILHLIERSSLSPEVQARAASLFSRLAEAEAAVHGTTPLDVHFHEVGAVDSIVDIVGSVIALDALGADRIASSPLNLGSGTVTMSHGVFSVPPPATARLVQGVPVYGAGEGELLTPTGALVITSYASVYGPLPLMRPLSIGYGAGTREAAGRPNLLRVLLGDQGLSAGQERVLVLETAIDDMSPQLCGPVSDRLLAAGALDVCFGGQQMKKGRPGLQLTVVARPQDRERLEEILFSETTTLGVRWLEWERTVLERELIPVTTAYGEVVVKIGRRGGRVYNAQPEFADCERAASLHHVPIKEVWAAALAAYRARG